MVDRVTATPATLELIQQLKQQYGPQLLFLQSGGCCDNSSPNCYLPGELTIGPHDIHLGDIGGVPFYMTAAQLDNGVIVGQLPAAGGAQEQFGMVLSKGSSLTACVSKAVDALRADGTLTKLSTQWLTNAGAPALK